MCNPMVFLLPVLLVFALVSSAAPEYLGLFFVAMALLPFAMVFLPKGEAACEDGTCGMRGKHKHQLDDNLPIHQFRLNFKLSSPDEDPQQLVDILSKSGCGDAIPVVGQKGYLVLTFARCAETEEEAIKVAVEAVEEAIPGAKWQRHWLQ